MTGVAGSGVRRVRRPARARRRARRRARAHRRAAARRMPSATRLPPCSPRPSAPSRCPPIVGAADIADVQSALSPATKPLTPDAALLALARRHGPSERRKCSRCARPARSGARRGAVARGRPHVPRLDELLRRAVSGARRRDPRRSRRRDADGAAGGHLDHRGRAATRARVAASRITRAIAGARSWTCSPVPGADCKLCRGARRRAPRSPPIDSRARVDGARHRRRASSI